MSKLANVKYGTAQLPSGKKIEVGFRQWYEWLEHPETKSFRVNDGEGYTARKETPNGYWYAYRKVGGKLHKRYIGLSKALTLRRLAEIGELFSVPTQPKLPKLVGNSTDKMQELPKLVGNLGNLEEILQQRIQQLENDIRNLEEILEQRQAALEEERKQVVERNIELKNLRNENSELRDENAELLHKKIEKSLERTDMLLAKQKEAETFIDNQKLQRELGNLQVENEALKAELAEVRSQVSPNTHNGNLGNLTLEADLAEAKSEIAALKRDYEESVIWYKNAHTKMSDELHKVKKADISFMIPQIKAERDRYADELAKANKQIIEMAEKNSKLQFVELPKLRAQLSSQTAPQNSEILDWPDPAALLNQLKSKRKKSRVDLQDVEAILELLLEMPAQKPKF